ncbi:MAG: serine/threonine protein kinase [Magnetococcales bacterium]|nr:serine/threonine protein kinase [Magnetococcales bacterium]MBF0420352.1 serine/threonine protein kinase [Magnetococcales bacterium]
MNNHHDSSHTAASIPYSELRPEVILNAVETLGWRCDGHLMGLNSYENRVYQVGLEDHPTVVVKFYRPGRWSDDAIIEEHLFCLELAELEIAAIPPLVIHGKTLHHAFGFRFSVTPRQGGRTPDLEDVAILERLGRFIGRIHAVAKTRPFVHRPHLNTEAFGVQTSQFLLQSGMIPANWVQSYKELLTHLLALIDKGFQQASPFQAMRLHGDCHAGNMLWTDTGPCFVDFDDARMGPPVQDLWMCLSGSREERTLQMQALLTGYQQFHTFPLKSLCLIEPLRTLRMIHHTAWIAKRWHDPAFPKAFPWFAEGRFWDNHIQALQEQIIAMEEPPLDILMG